MRCRPFESAASELVDESLHPVEQLKLLEAQANDRVALGDNDCIIECRIKQLSLQKVLHHLYDYPLTDQIRAQAVLAEAYAQGGYYKQARDHLARAREAVIGGVHDDVQGQRLQVDILIAEGVAHLAQEHLDKADAALSKASRVGREVFGDLGTRGVRIHSGLGQIAMQRGHADSAVKHFRQAKDAQDKLDDHSGESEEIFKLELRIAEAHHACGDVEEALTVQTAIVDRLQRLEKFPELLVDALAKQARWLEGRGGSEDNREALEALEQAESIVDEEDPKGLNIKRDIALLHLKLGNHDPALKYLNEVHYLERCLHGSQSTNVGRTLKALGTVHLVRHRYGEAEQCLIQALHIFEADHPPNQAIIRDIHAKLNNIAGALQGS